MILLDRTITKAVRSDAEYFDAAIATTDPYVERYRTSDAASMIARLASTLLICCTINAMNTNRCVQRLYRPVRAGRQKRNLKYGAVRVTDRRRLDWLRRADVNGPGTKAAQVAMGAGDIEEVIDHPVLDLLNNPSDGYTGGMFRTLTRLLMEATGRCGWLVVQPGGSTPTALHMLFPQHLKVMPGPSRIIDKFVYWVRPAKERVYDADDVVYLRHLPSPHKPWEAIGPAHAITSESDLIAAAVASELNRWKRGAQPDFWLGVSERTTDKQIGQLENDIRKKLAGVQKRQNFIIAPGGMKAGTLSQQNDMAYKEGLASAKRDLRNSYGIPESKADLNAANLASALTSDRQYQADTLLPRLQSEAEQWNAQLIPYYEDEPGQLFFAPDNPVTADHEMESRVAKTFVDMGARSIDEVRSEQGWEPLPDGQGEKYRINGVPIELAGMPVAAPTMAQDGQDTGTTPEEAKPAQGTAPTADVQQTALNGAQVTALNELIASAARGDIPLASVKPTLLISFPNAPEDRIDAIIDSLDGFEPPKPEPVPPAPGSPLAGSDGSGDGADGASTESGDANKGHSTPGRASAVAPAPSRPVDGRGTVGPLNIEIKDDKKPPEVPSAKPFEKVLQDYFSAYEPDVIARIAERFTPGNLAAIQAMGEQAGVEFLTPVGDILKSPEAQKELFDALMATTSPLMREGQHAGVGVLLGDGRAEGVDPWGVVPEDAINFLRGHNGKLSPDILTNYDDAVRSRVANELADVLSEPGLSQEKLQAAVARAIPGVSEAKARAIAETETTRAYNAGLKDAYKSSPEVVGFKWIAVHDPHTCPICDDLDGKIAMGDDKWEVSFGVSEEGPIGQPPAHTMCRCYIMPVYRDHTPKTRTP